MRLNKQRKRASSFFGLIFVLLILLIGVVGFFYFFKNNTHTEQGVNFWLSEESEQVAGDENIYFVNIQNNESRSLRNIEVVINFPNEFVLTSSIPECDQKLLHGCVWELETIKKQEVKKIQFNGQLFGKEEQEQIFTGYLNFYLRGFSSEFQEGLSFSTVLEPSLSLLWDIDEKISYFEQTQPKLVIQNIGDKTINKAQVVVDWPEDFFFQQPEQFDDLVENNNDIVEIDNDERTITWVINDFQKNEKRLLNFNGYVQNSNATQVVFASHAGLINNNEYFLQIEKRQRIEVLRFDFSTSLQINNNINTPQIYEWGDELLINLDYFNNTEQTVKDLDIRLRINNDKYIDIDDMHGYVWDYYNNIENTQSDITNSMSSSFIQSKAWDSDVISDFKEILPEQNGKIIFSLPIKTIIDARKNNYSKAEISMQVFAKGRFGNKKDKWEIKSNKINVKIKTSVELDSFVRYYDDERMPVGTGPLPPRVGDETRFFVFFHIKNTSNPIIDIIAKTKLGENIKWTGNTNTTHGIILYNENTNEITWQLSELPVYQGGGYSLVEARFELSFVPQSHNANLYMPLSKDIYFNAKDQFTDNLILIENNPLNSNLNTDPVGSGLGRIIEQ